MDEKLIERLGIISSCEVEEFCLAVFHDETSVKEDFGHNVVTTK